MTARREDGAACCFAPRFVLDASGRDTFMANSAANQDDRQAQQHRGSICPFPPSRVSRGRHGRLHLRAPGQGRLVLDHPVDRTGSPASASSAPRRPSRRGVGNPHDLLFERIRQSPTVSARMQAAELASTVMTAGNYSYRADAAGAKAT